MTNIDGNVVYVSTALAAGIVYTAAIGLLLMHWSTKTASHVLPIAQAPAQKSPQRLAFEIPLAVLIVAASLWISGEATTNTIPLITDSPCQGSFLSPNRCLDIPQPLSPKFFFAGVIFVTAGAVSVFSHRRLRNSTSYPMMRLIIVLFAFALVVDLIRSPEHSADLGTALGFIGVFDVMTACSIAIGAIVAYRRCGTVAPSLVAVATMVLSIRTAGGMCLAATALVTPPSLFATIAIIFYGIPNTMLAIWIMAHGFMVGQPHPHGRRIVQPVAPGLSAID